jgi:formylmethanofuran dehydrogenase subunit E
MPYKNVEDRRAAQIRYGKTAKGIAARRRHEQTEKYKERKAREERAPHRKEQRAAYRRTEPGRARRREFYRRSMEKAPEKLRARGAVAYAVKIGDLVRPDTCEHCAATDVPIEASHTDYARPLDVEWLCQPCHQRKDKP